MSTVRDMVYDRVIESNGVKIPVVPEIVTPQLEAPMRRNRYEGGECIELRKALRPGDRVLELGAGVGLLSTIAAKTPGVEHVVAVEANPEILPLIEETYALNDVENVTLLNGVIAEDGGGEAEFFIREDFWGSSMESQSRPFVRSAMVPTLHLSRLIEQYNPTVIVCDIEGAELGLFDAIELSGVRSIIIELHPKVYGRRNAIAICECIETKGLRIEPVERNTTVRSFTRPDVIEEPEAPNFLVSTCMKNEAPFILEWIAWHRAIGIQNFVVFTNDCTDGTDQILDRLEVLGYVKRLPNPAIATDSTSFQISALRYLPHLREWREADYFISMDVDEFINVRYGSGKLSDLLRFAPEFDALSISEINHGSNNHLHFEPGLVTEQFPRHETEFPGKWKARRGVKTIVRKSKKLERARNHRPDFFPYRGRVKWLDGSGEALSDLMDDASLNGVDCRGKYDLVVLNHFPLKSVDSFLAKMFRGNVVHANRPVSQRYWRSRNRNEELTSSFERQQVDFRTELDRLMSDEELLRLHEAACQYHVELSSDLRTEGPYRERRDWILQNSWDGDVDGS